MNTKAISGIILIALAWLGLTACTNSSQSITYSERNYDRMKDHAGITIKMIDGREFHYYKAELIKMTERDIWLKTWQKKNSEPQEVVFRRSDIVIEQHQYAASNTVTYVISMAVLIGLLALLNRWLY